MIHETNLIVAKYYQRDAAYFYSLSQHYLLAGSPNLAKQFQVIADYKASNARLYMGIES